MGRRAIVPDREWNLLLEQRAVLHLPDRYEREHDRAAQLRAVPVPRGPLGKLGRAQGPERGVDGPVAGGGGTAAAARLTAMLRRIRSLATMLWVSFGVAVLAGVVAVVRVAIGLRGISRRGGGPRGGEETKGPGEV